MPNYQNGRIYKIISDETDNIYIGSTVQILCKRMGQHRADYNSFQTRKEGERKRYCSSSEILKYPDARIILIENYPCNSKAELNAREEYHRRENKDICVNKQCCSTGIISENRQDYYKQYYALNADKKKAFSKRRGSEKIGCVCGSAVRRDSLAQHRKTKKHQQFIASQEAEA